MIGLSESQRERLTELWFVYGNYGKKHRHADHRFLQCLIERGQDLRALFNPSTELVGKVDLILQRADARKED